MTVTVLDLREIMHEVFQGSLGLGLEVAPDASEHSASAPVVAGGVHITGAWQAAVVITLDRALALQATGLMLQELPEDVTDEDLHDGIGELTNVVGGT
ncbi:chemotaxis protein CheX [Egibacter rhizosphaerae]|uniref:Chemotaxis protein CheX n=1 Tax=Egibacter rhizosphaerae TaxID=1670831 RepID=A0A411YJG0_9ACTN|nr:chemotaxis protein CheX [Egibacter rhizosphaerae]QBI21259.1 chemotaxis protein CheX [Egibacter rhizosphaerae]